MTDVTLSVITRLTCADQSSFTYPSVIREQQRWHLQFT
jgi:hypothetical protein